MDPRYPRQEVDYDGKEAPGTIVIDTPNQFLYLVEEDGKAIRYGIGVGRPGFTWSGTHEIFGQEGMAGLGAAEGNARTPALSAALHGRRAEQSARRARALSRLHALPYPRLKRAWTIGHNVSSGCIRMRNADVIDLYDRVGSAPRSRCSRRGYDCRPRQRRAPCVGQRAGKIIGVEIGKFPFALLVSESRLSNWASTKPG